MRELCGYHKENVVAFLSFFCRVCMRQWLVLGFYLDANVNSKHATWIADAYSKSNISSGEGEHLLAVECFELFLLVEIDVFFAENPPFTRFAPCE